MLVQLAQSEATFSARTQPSKNKQSMPTVAARSYISLPIAQQLKKIFLVAVAVAMLSPEAPLVILLLSRKDKGSTIHQKDIIYLEQP